MRQAKMGDRVRIEYARLRTRNAVLYRAKVPKVLDFTVGSSEIVSSVSKGVLGMAAGDSKRVTLEPNESYSDRQLLRSTRPLSDNRMKLEVRLLTIDNAPDVKVGKK